MAGRVPFSSGFRTVVKAQKAQLQQGAFTWGQSVNFATIDMGNQVRAARSLYRIFRILYSRGSSIITDHCVDFQWGHTLLCMGRCVDQELSINRIWPGHVMATTLHSKI